MYIPLEQILPKEKNSKCNEFAIVKLYPTQKKEVSKMTSKFLKRCWRSKMHPIIYLKC